MATEMTDDDLRRCRKLLATNALSERDRYRAALERIAEPRTKALAVGNCENFIEGYEVGVDSCRRIAREALEGKS